jgi:alpha-tubulin suppressor-like RCC1 family protein
LGDILKSKDERESYFDPFDREYIPKMIPPTKIDIKAVDLSLGHNRFSAIGIDHGLYFWGEPFLHTNSFESPYIDQPSLVPLPEKIQQISMGYSQLTVLTITGKVYEWNSDRGRGLYLFSESKNDPHLVFTKPSEILFPEIISSINSGGTSAAISKEGKLYMWGNNHFGQVSKSYPRVKILDIVPVSVGSKVKHLACADIFTSAVTENGEVLIWGEPLS